MNVHGNQRYDTAWISSLSDFVGGIQFLAQRLRSMACAEHLRVWVYGAATPGILAADILASCEGLEVPGLVDQNAIHAALCNRSTRSFHVPSRPVVAAERFRPLPGDAVLVVVNPEAAADVIAGLEARFPGLLIATPWQMEGLPPAWPEHPPLVVATVGRCGTHWLREMLESMLLPRGYSAVTARTPSKPSANPQMACGLAPSQFVVDHFRLDNALRAELEQGEFKAVFLYRDPRDVHVSRSYYNQQSYRFDPEDVADVCALIEPWLKSPALLVRYEELLQKTPRELARIAALLDIDVPGEELQQIVDYCSFEMLSGGRSPGEADPAHHYRKGVAGEWRKHMDAEQVALVRQTCGPALKAMGYQP